MLRYQRQIQLKELGEAGQRRLSEAKILVVGAGGLGCPALQYLAAAGVGKLGILDFDTVDISNLQRQVLYSMQDIGQPKAATASQKIRLLNPDIQVEVHHCRLSNDNALEIFSAYDLIIDGSDNFPTRYLVNDACVLLNKPLVYGAVLRFEGQVGVFNLEKEGIKTNYRDLFPESPAPETSYSCNEVGVLGVLPGIIGVMQATEAIKIVTGIGEVLSNKILSYNALKNTFFEFSIFETSNPAYSMPRTEAEFYAFNYEWFCKMSDEAPAISPDEFEKLRGSEALTIIDVREIGELPIVAEYPHLQIPMSIFRDNIDQIPPHQKIVIFCQTGKRSALAAKILKEKYPNCVTLVLIP